MVWWCGWMRVYLWVAKRQWEYVEIDTAAKLQKDPKKRNVTMLLPGETSVTKHSWKPWYRNAATTNHFRSLFIVSSFLCSLFPLYSFDTFASCTFFDHFLFIPTLWVLFQWERTTNVRVHVYMCIHLYGMFICVNVLNMYAIRYTSSFLLWQVSMRTTTKSTQTHTQNARTLGKLVKTKQFYRFKRFGEQVNMNRCIWKWRVHQKKD